MNCPKFIMALWSLRDKLSTADMMITLDWLKSIAIHQVEVGGFCNLPPFAFSEALKNRSLKVRSIHGPIIKNSTTPSEITEWIKRYSDIFETKHLCLSSEPQDTTIQSASERENKYRHLLSKLHVASDELQSQGISLSYHPYYHDLERKTNKFPLINLFEPKPNLSIQFDTYWAHAARFSYEDFLKLLPSIESIHVTPPISTLLKTDPCYSSKYYISILKILVNQDKKLDWILENDIPILDRSISYTIQESLDKWPILWESLRTS